MLDVVRRSQLLDLMAVDSATASHLGRVEEVWLDESGRIAYVSSEAGYLPLEQVAGVGTDALTTYGRLVVEVPTRLRRLHQQTIQSQMGEPLGWVDDFLFDWHTGEIVAYVLTGEIAAPWGGRAVLLPNDVIDMTVSTVTIRDGSSSRLTSESDGLQKFLSEKSHHVRHLTQVIRDRLHDLISPHDHPEVVHVKVKAVRDEMAASNNYDHHALQEAAEVLHHQWESLQHSISRAGHRAKAALESARKHIMGH